MVLGILKEVLRLRDWHIFMWQSLEILNVFITLTLKQVFWKTKTFFEKLQYRLLVECITIENKKSPYKTALSKANVKMNKTWAQNGWIKCGVLPLTTLFFLKI